MLHGATPSPRGLRGTALFIAAALVAIALGMVDVPGASAAQPVVNPQFRFTPSSPAVGQTVVFTSTSTVDAKNSIIALRWDLDGDGAFDDASGTTASRSFPVAGTYEVRLQVEPRRGTPQVATASVSVHVPSPPNQPPPNQPPPNQPPRASFASFPLDPVAGNVVNFFSTATDPDSPIASQAWDLNGDGTYGDAVGPSASRTFAAAGAHTVGLRVVDVAGAFSAFRRTLTVFAPGTGGTTTTGTLGGPGGRRLGLMSPFPVVRISGTIQTWGTRLRRLSISAPGRARVKVRCRGRGCPVRLRSREIAGARSAAVVRVRRLEGQLLRPRARIEVRVTSSSAIGKYTRFRFRKRKPPSRVDRCLVPGASKPAVCPR